MDLFRPDPAHAASQISEVDRWNYFASEVDSDTVRIGEQNGVTGNSSGVIEPIYLVAGAADELLGWLKRLLQLAWCENAGNGVGGRVKTIFANRSLPGRSELLYKEGRIFPVHD
jgi:hypothetical protein